MAPLLTWSALALTVIVVKAGYVIPADIPDGIYHVAPNEDGEWTHVKVGDIDWQKNISNATSADLIQPYASGSPAESLHRRHARQLSARDNWQDDGVHCDSNYVLDLILAQQSVNNLGNACDSAGDTFVPAWDSTHKAGIRMSAIYGAITYVCNYAHKSQHCLSSEVKSDIADILSTCHGRTGFFSHKGWGPKTYGIAEAGREVCN